MSYRDFYKNLTKFSDLRSQLAYSYTVLRALYKNKIVFQHDNEEVDIVFCKNLNDSIRFYNLLEEWVKINKNKQTFFMGSFNKCGERKKNIEKLIMDITGWELKKIQRSSTRS